jgi:hypothetical protein
MTYTGRVRGGVVVFEGAERPVDGVEVRVEVVTQGGVSERPVGEQLAKLAGAAKGLPADLVARHDHYRRERQS